MAMELLSYQKLKNKKVLLESHSDKTYPFIREDKDNDKTKERANENCLFEYE